MLGFGIFAGKKTYIVAILAFATALGGYLVGDIDLKGLIEAGFAAAAAMTLRSGIAKVEG